jgi:signal transduction histidine kinase
MAIPRRPWWRLASLRRRLFVGSLLWSLGLLFIAQVAAVGIVHSYWGSPPRFHFSNTTFYGIGIGLLVGAALAMVTGFHQVRKGLSTLDRLRLDLAEVHAGRAKRVEGRHPSEVAPLVEDLNALLDHRELAVRRAQEKAADLAHGLKTPLAVLTAEAADAVAAGQGEIGAAIHQQVERMRRQIEYQLTQARAAASGGVGSRAQVLESAGGVQRALDRLHAGRGLTIELAIDPEHVVRVERQDLDELVGNLLDNACKWGRRHVVVTTERTDDRIVLTVDDDGPGLDPTLRESVLQRGVRADEASPSGQFGSGLGLAIVRDLVEIYGGEIRLETSPAGGLRARLSLPAG